MKRLALMVVPLVALSQCVAPEDEFYGRVFLCNVENAGSDCGTDRSGKPMTCYPAHLLGGPDGQDFCAETCDPDVRPSDPQHFECIDALASSARGALVRRCDPSQGAAGCPSGLSCYRTDLVANEGLCIATRVCSRDSDCTDIGKVCGSTLIEDFGGSSEGLRTDSLLCVQRECSTVGSDCDEDQACLFDSFASGDVLPDICVPKCDNSGRCPPNFSCARKPGFEASPDICVPGIVGTRCSKDQDCLVGSCLDTGAGFHVCALPLPCTKHDDCANLDLPTDKFVCAEGIPGKPICVNRRPYNGSNCNVLKDECTDGQECRMYSSYTPKPDHGECRTPCVEGRCEPRGGIPYVCTGDEEQGGCATTDFGLPCSAAADCLKEFDGLAAGPDPRSLHDYSPSLCTARCTTDDDCEAIRLIGKSGFCEEGAGICRRRGQTDAPCDRKEHCYSDRCREDHTCG